MTSKTHYATLGVALTATQDQIKCAYRKLARRPHPDVNLEPVAEEQLKDVTTAHETLIDPERRRHYDAELAAPPRNGCYAGPRQDDLQPCIAAPHNISMQRALRELLATTSVYWRVRGADQHGVILVDLADAYRGATRGLDLQIAAFDVRGTLVFSDRHFDVRIPRGVRDGQQLRLKGLGAAGQGGALAGDLYLEVIFKPHPPFSLDGRDVYFDLRIAPWEAALGASVLVATPTGKVLLTIPPGSVPQQRLRLKGLGLPGSPPGDLYAVLGITLPPADSTATRQAWLALANAFHGYRPRS